MLTIMEMLKLYCDLVSHYTQGLTGKQQLEIIERKMDDLTLDSKWGKSCESFLNLVDNKLKDHKGITPDPTQYPDSWYINQINHIIESHTTHYQYIVNHQMQAESIANHLGTTSATVLSYESHVETIQTFCQTIDHANSKVIHEKNQQKALQAEFQQTPGYGKGRNHGCGDGRGCNPGRGMNTGRNQPGCNPTSRRGRTGGHYHNWVPQEQFGNLDEESYQRLIHDCIACGEVQANNTDSAVILTTTSEPSPAHYSVPCPKSKSLYLPHKIHHLSSQVQLFLELILRHV